MQCREKLKRKVLQSKRRRSQKAKESYEQDIKESRSRLLAEIEDFHLQAEQFLDMDYLNKQETPHEDKEDSDSDQENESSEDEYRADISDVESDEEQATKSRYGHEEGIIQPENVRLQLPSTFGKDACTKGRKWALANEETDLRKGQAHDALAGIRAGITLRYCLYKDRSKSNYAGTTRSMSAIQTVNEDIQQHVDEYDLAFKALTSLGAGKAWKRLKKKHLKGNVDLEKGNQWGQSKSTQSWIWKVGSVGKDLHNDEYLREGGQYPFPGVLKLTICPCTS
jgi:hypothetical protein